MRILVVNWQDRENPQAGGAELHLHEVFGRIARWGHSVDLLCSGFDGGLAEVELDGISVHRVGGRYSFPLHARRYYNARLRQREHNVLIEDLNKVPLFTSRWRAGRTVVLVHHLFGETAFREAPLPVAALVWLLERPIPRVYRSVPFQAVSQSTAFDLVERGVRPEAIRVIYNGVDVEQLTPAPSARAAAPGFLYLGRLRRYKNIDTLIRAMALLDEPEATLSIAGTGPDRARLERLVRSLDLAHRVRFLGFVSEADKLSLFRQAWATLLASPKEGWGISNLESAACGTPVIAADAPGIRESVRHAETGLLVANTPMAFAAEMSRLCREPQLVANMGAAGRAFAEQFTWERAARDTLMDLEQIVTARGRGGRQWQ